ncbi:MAG: secondary thiamine-phosphate synthase enzyme YjbQ [Candidatus Aureabacteria bacterium]|nr:secondary thiamine-phosphate synthase enzyme YjbQ [Candidatus Auribacterota bacterium]
MSVETREINFRTKGNSDIVDITDKIATELETCKIRNGVVTMFVPGSTAALSTIEYERGVVSDLNGALERLIPSGISYKHNLAWDDGNGHSHVRASLIGPSLSVPIVKGNMTLGTWQQIVFIDFDNRSRNRIVIIQVVGEE